MLRQIFRPLDKSGYEALAVSLSAGLYVSVFYIFNNLTMLRGTGILFILSIMIIPLLLLTILTYYPLQLARKTTQAQTIVVFIVSVFLFLVLRPTLLDIDVVNSFFLLFSEDKKTIANILYVVVPSILITIIFKKNILIYTVMLSVMTLAAVIMNIPKLMDDNAALTSSMPLHQIESLKLNEKPNIYFILTDAYGSLAYMKEHEIDVSELTEYLTSTGFHLYEDTYSNYQPTTNAMSAILNMEHHHYSLTGLRVDFSEVSKAARVIIGGQNNVSKILRQNGYSIQYIHGRTYLLVQGCSADECFPETNGLAGARIILSHIFKIDLLSENDKRAKRTITNAQLREQSAILRGRDTGTPRFQYIHAFDPGHAPNNQVGRCNESFEIGQYAERIQSMGKYLRDQVADIVESEPDAVIIIAGDHGPFISKRCGRVDYIDNLADYRDRASAITAIRWPESYDGRYDPYIKSSVNLFRYVLASLATDATPLLNSVAPDDVFVRGGNKVYKIIGDGEQLDTPEEYLRTPDNGGYSTPSRSVRCDDPDRGSEIEQGMCFYTKRQYQQALLMFKKASQLDPENALAFNNICSAYNKMGQFKQGIEACEKALEISPDYDRAQNNLNWAKRQIKAGKGIVEK